MWRKYQEIVNKCAFVFSVLLWSWAPSNNVALCSCNFNFGIGKITRIQIWYNSSLWIHARNLRYCFWRKYLARMHSKPNISTKFNRTSLYEHFRAFFRFIMFLTVKKFESDPLKMPPSAFEALYCTTRRQLFFVKLKDHQPLLTFTRIPLENLVLQYFYLL